MTEEELKEYNSRFNMAWKFFKFYALKYPKDGTKAEIDAYWENLIEQANNYYKKREGDKLTKDLIVSAMTELDRYYSKGERYNGNTKQVAPDDRRSG